MSELQVEGAALKKLLKLAKKNALPFAFNPSPKIPECYLAMHRKKPAKILGKDAKDEGVGPKSAFGTIKVEKKLLVLQCDRVVPNLAKTLKKYMKLQKVMLNIEVRDADGTVLDADVEDNLPDDPELEGEVEDETTFDSAALAKRLANLRTRIQALDPAIAEKLNGAFSTVVSLFKKEQFAKCAAGCDQIEAAMPKPGAKAKVDPAIAKLAELHKQFTARAATVIDQKKRLNIEKALAQVAGLLKAGKAPEATALLAKVKDALQKALADNVPDAPPPPDPKAMKLVEMLSNYRKQLSRVTDDKIRAAIAALLDKAAIQIKAPDLDKATESLVRARDALKAAIAAAKKAEDLAKAKQREQETPDAPEEEALSPEQAKQQTEWNKVHKELSGKVDAALTKGLVADMDGLRKDWNWAVNNAADHKYAEALANIPAVRKQLANGTEDGKSVFTEDISPDAKPFAESRVRWTFARGKMQAEMGKLTKSIIDAVKDDPELSHEVSSNLGNLTDHLLKLDERLEDKLDQIVNESDAPTRNGFKQEARKIIGQYRDELASDFFNDVDANSGFANVAITATAHKALGAIETVLQ